MGVTLKIITKLRSVLFSLQIHQKSAIIFTKRIIAHLLVAK